jgi:hypothetical protein
VRHVRLFKGLAQCLPSTLSLSVIAERGVT